MLAVCSALTAIAVVVYGFNITNRWRYRHMPGPRPAWLAGNLKQLNVPFDSHIMLNLWAKQYGAVYKMFVGHTPVVVVTDPQLVKQICTKSFMKFHNRPLPTMRFHHGHQADFEEAGMMLARGKFWAGIRAACEPLFHSKVLKAHAPLMNQAATNLQQRLAAAPEGQAVQINSMLAGLTMEVIGGAAFGVDFGSQSDNKSPIVEHAQSLFQPPNSSGFAAMRFLMFSFPLMVPVMYRAFIWLGAERIQQVMHAKGYIVGTSQVLLTNARQASSSSSSSASSTDEDTAQHAQRDDPKAGTSDKPDVTSATAVRPGAAADSEVPILNTHASSAMTSPSNKAVPSQATLPIDTAAGCAVTPAVAATEAGSTSGNRSQCATYMHSWQGRAQQTVNYVCDKLQHGWRTVKAWLPKQPQKQLQKQLHSMMQPVLWGRVTEAANKCTGQGIAAQPSCRPDSWLTAPAEVQYQRGRLEGGKAYEHEVPEGHSLLYSLMNARRKDNGQPLTHLDICAQSFTFVLAGYETTSVALSYALYEIAQDPGVQQRLQAEADAFGRDKEPGYDDLAGFPYTEAVFLEGMRLHPPVTPFIALIRETEAAVELGGHTLPAGTKVALNILGMHHDPNNFPDPQTFKPERFMDGPLGPSSRHPYAFIPFGAGPRKCIGHRFAMEESVLTLVRLAQKFWFTLDAERHAGKPLLHSSLITYMPRDGIWLHAKPRQQA